MYGGIVRIFGGLAGPGGNLKRATGRATPLPAPPQHWQVPLTRVHVEGGYVLQRTLGGPSETVRRVCTTRPPQSLEIRSLNLAHRMGAG
eukprot:921256-Rhodomonas_salina.2